MIFSFLCNASWAQTDSPTPPDSSVSHQIDSLTIAKGLFSTDSLLQDSIHIGNKNVKKISPNAVTETVSYKSLDSARIDIKNKISYLYNHAVVNYEDLELSADYITMGFGDNELFASGVASEEGLVTGTPSFAQGGTTYRAHEIRYNFQTKKGKITKVITTEGEGYIHGKIVKKIDDSTAYIKGGKYTTCDLEDPHFEIAFTKGKFIKNDKIVTGPAYLSFVGVPTPLAIPFGYFPIQKERSSGIVMPTFDNSSRFGFGFKNLGYYIGINDNFDLLLGGSIYTRGSWGVMAKSNYVYRYVCNGVLDLSFEQNFEGERLTPSRTTSNDFKVYWKHNQDPKSHPTTRFNALVNIVSASYSRNAASSSINDYLSNQYSSSLNFSTNIKGFFYLDAALTYNQNTSNHLINLTMPDINMSVNQFYPFRKKKKVGALKWYDNISMKWNARTGAQINTTDSTFKEPKTWQQINMGMMHTIPITIPVKIAKTINWNTSITLTERWYMQGYEKRFRDSTNAAGVHIPMPLDNIFKQKFGALHDLNLSSNITTRVFFMYQFTKGSLLAVRHIMTPTLNFTFRPKLNNSAYGTYFNTFTGREEVYSYYDGAMYGSVGNNMQAQANFSISNNLEIKVKSKRDTITGTRKIMLIENLTINGGYDFAADSLKWQHLSISGRTTLFKQLYVTFNIRFDPYSIGTEGRRINVTEWKANKKLLRFSHGDISLGLNWTIDQSIFGKGKKKKENAQQAQINGAGFTENTLGLPNIRPDFSTPWSITLNYTFAYTNEDNLQYYINRDLYVGKYLYPDKYTNTIVQTLNVSADFSITKKWKVGITTGYDFTQKDISFTSIDIYRDLHCWEMRFNWIPFGYRKGWSFTINVKASVLQDLKYNMKRDFRDNDY
jgi:lipopolysaccharide assembly outer membrane protein LptD (OstA)